MNQHRNDEKNGNDGKYTSHTSHDPSRLLPPLGNYKTLRRRTSSSTGNSVVWKRTSLCKAACANG